jgi:RimJ/RimL family protein N-acetyltransferase
VEAVEISAGDLRLRPWRRTDAAAVERACQDPGLRPWAGEARHFVTHLAPAMLADDTAVPLGIFDARSGDLLGSSDLRALDLHQKSAELGYWSAPWARGRRVTERASRALLSWGFERLGLLRVDWKTTVGNHASRLTGLRLGFRMVGRQPAAAHQREQWLAALLPGDLTAAGTDVAEPVRRQAHVFGRERPTVPAGPVTLRPPAERDRRAIVTAYTDPEIIRWFGVPDPYFDADARRYIQRDAPQEWARGAEAIFVVAGPGDTYAGSVDLRVSAHDPAAGEIGFLIAPQARGRGYATAAVRALTAWGFAELGLARIQWRAEVGNATSWRVAEKAGFTMEGRLRGAHVEDGTRRDCWIGSLLATDVAAAGTAGGAAASTAGEVAGGRAGEAGAGTAGETAGGRAGEAGAGRAGEAAGGTASRAPAARVTA